MFLFFGFVFFFLSNRQTNPSRFFLSFLLGVLKSSVYFLYNMKTINKTKQLFRMIYSDDFWVIYMLMWSSVKLITWWKDMRLHHLELCPTWCHWRGGVYDLYHSPPPGASLMFWLHFWGALIFTYNDQWSKNDKQAVMPLKHKSDCKRRHGRKGKVDSFGFYWQSLPFIHAIQISKKPTSASSMSDSAVRSPQNICCIIYRYTVYYSGVFSGTLLIPVIVIFTQYYANSPPKY